MSTTRGSARLRRLDDRGQELRGGGAARARERDRAAGGAGDAGREERARALVQMHVQVDVGVARQREGERRRARAGREACVAHAAGDEPVDERPRAREVEVGDVHHRPRPSISASITAPLDWSTVASTSPSAVSRPRAACVAAVPVSTGISVASGGRADDLHRTDREHPRGEAEQRPLRQARALDGDVDEHADRDRRERGDHRGAVEAAGRAVADAHGERALAARPRRSGCRAGCSPRGSPRRGSRAPPRPTRLPPARSRPSRTRCRTSPSARRTRRP